MSEPSGPIMKAAESAFLTVFFRVTVIVTGPIIVSFFLWAGTRLVHQLDENTTALAAISQQMAVTAVVLAGMEKRVDVLEQTDRSRRADRVDR